MARIRLQTALTQIAAEELDFPVARLEVVMGTTSETVDQGPSYGSRTVRYAGPQIRHAATAGREALLALAATHFKVSAHRLATKAGEISVIGAPHRTISYGRPAGAGESGDELRTLAHAWGRVSPGAARRPRR